MEQQIAPPAGSLDQATQYLDQCNARYRTCTTGFGLQLIAYLGSDGFIHVLVGNGEEQNTLFAPWENGLATLASIPRMKEVVEAVDTMSRSIFAQIEYERSSQAQTTGERRPSDKYEPDSKSEHLFRGWEWEVDGFKLSDEQIDAVKLILSGNRLCTILTGQAGAGKSAVVRFLQVNGLVTVTATTGRAALNVAGITVDSKFCFNRDKWEVWSWGYVEKCMNESHKIIVIDEASMVGEHMANLIMTVAEKFRKNLVLVGDWAQASPVKDDWGHKSRLIAEANFIRLEECHRQSDEQFIRVLNNLRIGRVDQEVEQVMSKRVSLCPDEAGWVRMFATNSLARGYNEERLTRHCQEEQVYPFTLHCRFNDERKPDKQASKPRSSAFIQKECDATPFAHLDQFAIGAQVLITSNDISEVRQFANGDVGILKDVRFKIEVPEEEKDDSKSSSSSEDSDDLMRSPKTKESEKDPPKKKGPKLKSVWWSKLSPEERLQHHGRLSDNANIEKLTVTLERNDGDVYLERQGREGLDGCGNIQHIVEGFPIRLGWALTIHKTQGMTVDNAWLDMESILRMPEKSRHGLAYVGLSRVRTLEGLRISSWRPDVVFCDPEVQHLI